MTEAASGDSSIEFAMHAVLCNADGLVTEGAFWQGTDYECTGSAHDQFGQRILCTSVAHHDAATGVQGLLSRLGRLDSRRTWSNAYPPRTS